MDKNARLSNIFRRAFHLYQGQPGTFARPKTKIEDTMNKALLTLAALTLSTGFAFADAAPSVTDPVSGMEMPINQIDFSQLTAEQMAALISEMQAMSGEHRQQAQEMMQAQMQEMSPEAMAELRAAMQQEMQNNGGMGNGSMDNGSMGNGAMGNGSAGNGTAGNGSNGGNHNGGGNGSGGSKGGTSKMGGN